MNERVQALLAAIFCLVFWFIGIYVVTDLAFEKIFKEIIKELGLEDEENDKTER